MSTALKDLALHGPSEAEIEKAKTLLIGRQKKNGQTTLELLDMYSADYFGLNQVVEAEARIDSLRSVTSNSIAALVKEFSTAASQVFSGVGSIEEADFAAIYGTFATDLYSVSR